MKTILDGLESCECRWPIGRETGIRQRFCCMEVEPGRSYCRKHLIEAYGCMPKPVRREATERLVGRGYSDGSRSAVGGGHIGVHRPPVDELIKVSIYGSRVTRNGSEDIAFRFEHGIEQEME